MKIKIIFSFLSAVFFTLGMLFISMDGRLGEVLGDTTLSTGLQGDNQIVGADSPGTVTALLAPELVGSLTGPTSVRLNWTRPANASGTVTYKIKRNGTPIKTFTDVLSYEDVGLNPGSKYEYAVWAGDSAGRTSKSAVFEATIPAPVGAPSETASSTGIVSESNQSDTIADVSLSVPALSGSLTGPTSVRLNWTRPANASGTVTYKIKRNGTPIKTFTDALSYEDVGLNPGSKYEYAVWAGDSVGRVVQASPVNIILPKPVLPAVNAVSESASPVSGSKTTYSDSGYQKSASASTDATKAPLPGQEERDIDPSSVVTLSDRDSDRDGLPDAEEIRVGSDPFGVDTDGDGFPDGEEVKRGFNPLKSATSDRGDKVVFESPKEKRISKASVEDRRLRVEKVERVVRENGGVGTKISGKGIPNTFLTVYIYSDPIVVTVKADENGNWSYELDRDLEDGNHEVYVAVTDATGRISSQSSPIPFVKTAQAISIGSVSDMERAIEGNRSPVERAGGQFIFFGIAIVIMFLLGAFYFIGHRAFSD